MLTFLSHLGGLAEWRAAPRVADARMRISNRPLNLQVTRLVNLLQCSFQMPQKQIANGSELLAGKDVLGHLDSSGDARNAD